MLGEAIIARSLGQCRIRDKFGNRWQYHSRSDRHSKIACWAILFDILQSSSLLKAHVETGKVGFGVNHEMHDFRQNRKKNLDLVLCSGKALEGTHVSFASYGRKIGIELDAVGETELSKLPTVYSGRKSNVLIALEAKACMTEHTKAQPRLYDELASSFQTIHGDTNRAVAAAFVMINCADSFVSPDRNRKRIRGGRVVINTHRQPDAAAKVLEKVMKLLRRSDERESGFDAVGVTMVRCCNDRSPITIDETANASLPKIVSYGEFIHRLTHLYATKFAAI